MSIIMYSIVVCGVKVSYMVVIGLHWGISLHDEFHTTCVYDNNISPSGRVSITCMLYNVYITSTSANWTVCVGGVCVL